MLARTTYGMYVFWDVLPMTGNFLSVNLTRTMYSIIYHKHQLNFSNICYVTSF